MKNGSSFFLLRCPANDELGLAVALFSNHFKAKNRRIQNKVFKRKKAPRKPTATDFDSNKEDSLDFRSNVFLMDYNDLPRSSGEV